MTVLPHIALVYGYKLLSAHEDANNNTHVVIEKDGIGLYALSANKGISWSFHFTFEIAKEPRQAMT